MSGGAFSSDACLAVQKPFQPAFHNDHALLEGYIYRRSLTAKVANNDHDITSKFPTNMLSHYTAKFNRTYSASLFRCDLQFCI